MKKTLFLSASAAFLLTACGAEEASLSAEQVLTESAEAMGNVDSYTVTTNMDQSMEMAGEESMDYQTISRLELTKNPLTYTEKTEMTMADGAEKLAFTSYFHEEQGFFLEDPLLGGWVKLPEETHEEMLALAGLQMSPEEQLNQLQEFVEETKIEETNSEYILSLSGENFDVQQLMEQVSGLGEMEEMGEVMEDVEIQQFDYTVHIEKESFRQTGAAIDMGMLMDTMGQMSAMEQTITMEMKNFDSIDPISIPAEVIEEAEEVQASF
ncbi:DUF6612 family protein [Alkalicoccus halolimnae]|uniref:DUF6612 family protein n=1 Tax=Alkalicoccus halolimnae TaxID=1667239 RepID=A0A5C7FIJ1_9BACI|nr:DUF6612 family protein [Alkalicoccus halolimnae]TXF83982.1 hypothetical protein FTX54_11895 [Alkalicoccus halolimnae]